jgi:hypothetical protein
MKATILALLANADPAPVGHLLLRFGVIPLLLGLALSLAAILWALRNAPEGYEDENGFHFKQSRPVISQSPGVAILRPRNAG